MTLAPKVWEGALRRLAEELPRFVFDSWIGPLSASIVDSERLRLECPTAFHRERIRVRYLPRIADALRSETGATVNIELCVRAARALPGDSRRRSAQVEPLRQDGAEHPEPTREARTVRHRTAQHVSGGSGPAATSSGPQQRNFSYSFENFVVARGNTLAREVTLALARGDQAGLSQLIITSPSGMGKTHLARAAVREARSQCDGRVIYAPAEAFTNAFTESVRTKQMAHFKRRFRDGCKLLVIEDIHFLAGKRGTQLELFHTIQQVVDRGGRALITSQRTPRELDTLEPCLRSQLEGAFLTELALPDQAGRRGILRTKAAGGGVRLSDECLERLASCAPTSVRELEALLIQVVTTASLLGRKIDLALVDEVLHQKGTVALPSEHVRKPSIEQVVGIVARFSGLQPEALASKSRRRDVLVPRQLAMYLARRYTDATMNDIGWAFGRRHTSVRNAIEKIEREILERAPLRYRVEALSAKLEELTRR